jgi:hypothetical protein
VAGVHFVNLSPSAAALLTFGTHTVLNVNATGRPGARLTKGTAPLPGRS